MERCACSSQRGTARGAEDVRPEGTTAYRRGLGWSRGCLDAKHAFGMASHRDSIIVGAPPRDVFAYVSQPATIPEWMVGMTEVHNVIGRGEGQQYEWTYKMLGMLFRGQNVVVEYVEGERVCHQSIGMIRGVWTILVEPEPGGGGTALAMEAEYSIPVPVLGRFAGHLAERRNERDMRAGLLNIKEVLEGGTLEPSEVGPA